MANIEGDAGDLGGLVIGYVCGLCGYKTELKVKLNTHWKFGCALLQMEEKYVCGLCGYQTELKEKLDKHWKFGCELLQLEKKRGNQTLTSVVSEKKASVL